jgi:hypothetical protein
MKIPTKHSNAKHSLLAVGAIAAAVGLAPVATTFAYGGYSGDNRKDPVEQVLSSHNQSWPGHEWWHIPSAEDFAERHESKLAVFDKVTEKRGLTIENEETLRANLETDAAEVSAALTAYAEVKAELEDTETPTDEQKAELKQATMDALSALYDYKESSKAYVSAIVDTFKAE